MDPNEVRYQVISTLLQADGPLTFTEIAGQCEIAEKDILPILSALVNENLIVEGEMLPAEVL